MSPRFFVLIVCLIALTKSYAITRQEIEFVIQLTKHPLEIVRHFLNECPKILEAGGHEGEDTVNMHLFWPKSTIYSFEPNPFAYEKMKERVKGYDQIFTYPLALFNYDGMVQFFIQLNNGNDGASSVLLASPEYSELGHQHSWWYIDREIEVPCITLDSWAKREGIEEIDFMWLDMEGAELFVLKAGTQVLRNVKAIYTEVNFQEFRIQMTQYKDLFQFLNDQGFEQIFFEGDTSFQGNAIFVNKKLIK